MTTKPILIAGGGIGGLATALTLHQIGVPCLVLEGVRELKPLGVGINLQPNAVRELFELGIGDAALSEIGVRCREWALVGLNGNEIYAEPRGLDAGYKWPQYSVHRGELLMLLYREVIARLGHDAVLLGHRVKHYQTHSDGVTVHVETEHGMKELDGALLIGADGIHSAVRQQMHPDQPPIHWGGAIMWRGTSPGVPTRSGASFIGLGTPNQRVIAYPISEPDPKTGIATINWIAEITIDNSDGLSDGDWNKSVQPEEIIPHFADWDYGWLNVPELIANASSDILEYPMIDRDPAPFWVDGPVALLGDAAHAMYPTGSHGATQAIVDARVLGACLLSSGINRQALQTYNDRLCADISAVVLRNRGAGPFGILSLVDERCGGIFEDINDVVAPGELEEFMSVYKNSAGYAMETLNQAEPTIPTAASINL